MKKAAAGAVLLLASVVLFYEAWSYSAQLTGATGFFLGVAAGSCLSAGLLVILWRPRHPATRYEATLPSPSPWDRNRWR